MGIVEQQDHLGSFEIYDQSNDHIDEFDWKEYKLEVAQNENQVSEITFDLSDATISGNKDHKSQILEISSRF